MEKIKLTIQAKAENIGIARLTTSAVGMKVDFDIDEIEDLKLCVGEACNILLEKTTIESEDSINIEFTVSDNMDISVSAEKAEPEKEDIKLLTEEGKHNYALMIIETLMDGLNFCPEDGIEIKMMKELECN